jgi:hypothetical protein
MEKIDANKCFFDCVQYDKMIANMSKAARDGNADAAMDIDDVKRVMDSFCSYVNTVDMTEVRIRIAYARLDGVALRDAVQLYDASRRNAHEAAIASASAINRYARFYGAEKIYLGDTANRFEIADFCLEVAVKLFERGQGHP